LPTLTSTMTPSATPSSTPTVTPTRTPRVVLTPLLSNWERRLQIKGLER
jgi:hypothetical protein